MPYSEPVLRPLGSLRELTFKSGEKNSGEKYASEKHGSEKHGHEGHLHGRHYGYG